MVSNLKDHSSWSMIQAAERASERVNSWPEWKRNGFNFRRQDSSQQQTSSEAKAEQQDLSPLQNR
jgi:hypothetical protein